MKILKQRDPKSNLVIKELLTFIQATKYKKLFVGVFNKNSNFSKYGGLILELCLPQLKSFGKKQKFLMNSWSQRLHHYLRNYGENPLLTPKCKVYEDNVPKKISENPLLEVQ